MRLEKETLVICVLLSCLFASFPQASAQERTDVEVADVYNFRHFELNYLDTVKEVQLDSAGRLKRVDFVFGGDGLSIKINRFLGHLTSATYFSASTGWNRVTGTELEELMKVISQRVATRMSPPSSASAAARSGTEVVGEESESIPSGEESGLGNLGKAQQVRYTRDGRLAEVRFTYGGDGLEILFGWRNGVPVESGYFSLSKGQVVLRGAALRALVRQLESIGVPRFRPQVMTCSQIF